MYERVRLRARGEYGIFNCVLLLLLLWFGGNKNFHLFLYCYLNQYRRRPSSEYVFTSSISSVTTRSECSVRRRRTRSWRCPTIWTILRRFWSRVGCVSVRFWTSCCLSRRYRRVPRLLRRDIRALRRGRPGHRHLHESRISRFSRISQFSRPGIANRLSRILRRISSMIFLYLFIVINRNS